MLDKNLQQYKVEANPGDPGYKSHLSDSVRQGLSDTLQRWIDCDEALHCAMYLQYMSEEAKDAAFSYKNDVDLGKEKRSQDEEANYKNESSS